MVAITENQGIGDLNDRNLFSCSQDAEESGQGVCMFGFFRGLCSASGWLPSPVLVYVLLSPPEDKSPSGLRPP